MRCVIAISITYFLCVCVCVALDIQHAKRMRFIVCRLWPVWIYHILSILSHKRHNFREKKFIT